MENIIVLGTSVAAAVLTAIAVLIAKNRSAELKNFVAEAERKAGGLKVFEDLEDTSASARKPKAATVDPSEWLRELFYGFHNHALSEMRMTTKLSAVAAVIGFGYILYFGAASTTSGLEKLFEIVPGAIVSLVSGLFFVQTQRSRRQASEYFEKLTKQDQDIRAIRVTETMESSVYRDQLRAAIALKLAGLSPDSLPRVPDALDSEQDATKADTASQIQSLPGSLTL